MLAAKVPEVTVAEDVGLEGPKLKEDPFWPWFVLLWWPADWLPPEHPTPPGPWVWHPWTRPEMFAVASQLDNPEGHLELECWEGASFASP